MNYSLGFPDLSRELAISPKQSLEAVVAYFQSKHLEADSAVRAIHHQPAAEGTFADIPSFVDPKLRAALAKRGIARLYSHQADAFDQIQAGRHVVIVTPTASGKTLCYNLPVLNLLMRDEGARAMYLFPTKALAEDQLHEFQRAVEEMGSEIRAFTYDGDTPQTPAAPSASAPTSCSPIPTCCTPASCRTTPNGRAISRTCATSSSTSCTTIAASTAAIWPTCCPASSASASSITPSRNSSAARPPSPTRANWPRRSPANLSNCWSATARRAARSFSSSTIRRSSTGNWASAAATSPRRGAWRSSSSRITCRRWSSPTTGWPPKCSSST